MENQETENKVSIARLEEKFEGLATNVNLILTNHLPHIQSGVDRLENKFNSRLPNWATALIAILTGIIGWLVSLL